MEPHEFLHGSDHHEFYRLWKLRNRDDLRRWNIILGMPLHVIWQTQSARKLHDYWLQTAHADV
ncbi:hypothetical protein A8B82_06285 [Sulfitobacter sp. EhC04]|nr:hypothetical protein A8B82_06285 [Sulfitobacter sp. EhC04]